MYFLAFIIACLYHKYSETLYFSPALQIANLQQFRCILSHVNKVSSLKLWYSDKSFAETVVRESFLQKFLSHRLILKKISHLVPPNSFPAIVAETGMKMKNVDVYPYSEVSGLLQLI